VAVVLEGLMGLAARAGHLRTRTGPKDPALRRARVCYDHLAGDLGVQMFDHLARQRLVRQERDRVELSPRGERFVAAFGIDLAALPRSRRPLCKTCLDWSARRSHLAGALGSAMLARLYALNWASREPGSRIVSFTRSGERQFHALFGAGSATPQVPKGG
jgi:hypothetical protein